MLEEAEQVLAVLALRVVVALWEELFLLLAVRLVESILDLG